MRAALVTLLAVAGLAFALGPTPAQADFIDNFDSYTSSVALPAPWAPGPDFGNTMLVSPAGALYGFGGTKGAHGPSGSWWDAVRLTNYDVTKNLFTLSWKARLTDRAGLPANDGSIARVTGGLHDSGIGQGFGWEMRGVSGGDTGVLECGGLAAASSSGCGAATVDKGVWYEISVHLAESAGTWSFTSEFARFNGATFDAPLAHGSGTFNAGFVPEYVNMVSIYAFDESPDNTATIDDIAFVSIPEPATALLLGIGLLGLLRRRARRN